MFNQQLRALLREDSEINQRLAEISAGRQTNATKEEAKRLLGRRASIQPKIREQLDSADPQPGTGHPTVPNHIRDPNESAEYRAIRGRCDLTRWVKSVISGSRLSDGAEAELASAAGCEEGDIPLGVISGGDSHMFLDETVWGVRMEQPMIHHGRDAYLHGGVTIEGGRAATGAPANAPWQMARPTVPAAFSRTVLASLGVSMPNIPYGQANFPRLATPPPSSPVAGGAPTPDTAAAYALEERRPVRIGGTFTVRDEDLAIFPQMQTDLSTAIRSAVGNELDNQGLKGDGSDPNLNGLLNQAAAVAVADAKETHSSGVARFAELVDGHYAYDWAGIRAVMGPGTFALYAGLYRTNGDDSLYDYLMGRIASLRVSNRVPDPQSSGQQIVVLLTGQPRLPELPLWGGIRLLRDPYTRGRQGETNVYASVLAGSPFIPYGQNQVKRLHPKIA